MYQYALAGAGREFEKGVYRACGRDPMGEGCIPPGVAGVDGKGLFNSVLSYSHCIVLVPYNDQLYLIFCYEIPKIRLPLF